MVSYCRANLSDLLSIEQIERDCFPTEAFNCRLIKNLLINPKSVVIKATTGLGEIIGYITGIVRKEKNLPIGWIFSLCVIGAHRKNGVATQLIKLLERDFCSRGARRIKLEVSTHNTSAQLFYKRHGYLTTTVVLPAFYNDGTDAFVMDKPLP